MAIDVVGGGTCALCPAQRSGSGLVFFHERRGERLWLEIGLCETCGNRMEKHLKRAIPKRLFGTTPTAEGEPAYTLFHLADTLGLGWE